MECRSETCRDIRAVFSLRAGKRRDSQHLRRARQEIDAFGVFTIGHSARSVLVLACIALWLARVAVVGWCVLRLDLFLVFSSSPSARATLHIWDLVLRRGSPAHQPAKPQALKFLQGYGLEVPSC
jgi:hypothetical protein